MKKHPVYGLLAEFETSDALLEAAHKAHASGYKRLDAFTPFPVEGLADALGFHSTRVPMIVFFGGLIGCLGGFFLQYYPNVIGYPLNIGGKPYFSWPSFIPITFELTILCAALATVFGMLALNGLPTPYHPVFNVPRFALASKDRFFLIVFASDPKYDAAVTRQFLEGFHPRSLSEVPS